MEQEKNQLGRAHEDEKQEIITTISQAVEEAFEQGPIGQSVESICRAIRESADCRDTTLTVSPILEHLSKGRKLLVRQIATFLGVGRFSSSLLYRYDPATKSFHHFLPSPQNNFNLLLLCQSKKGVTFGAASKGVGRQSKALAFNLTAGTTFPSSETCEASTKYEAGMLIVGNGEIKLRNNYGCEVIVQSGIFGARAFRFQKEELVGAGEKGESVPLTGFELHRLDTY